MTKKKRPHDHLDSGEPICLCRSCNVPLVDHPGLTGTCARLQEALTALREIRTWAEFEGGVDLDAEHLVKLCDNVLKGKK